MTARPKPQASLWTAFRVWRRAAHARKLIRASATAFDAGKRQRVAMLLDQAREVVAEMAEIGAAIG